MPLPSLRQASIALAWITVCTLAKSIEIEVNSAGDVIAREPDEIARYNEGADAKDGHTRREVTSSSFGSSPAVNRLVANAAIEWSSGGDEGSPRGEKVAASLPKPHSTYHSNRLSASDLVTDWIVVGGGASGCAAAASLAEAGEDVLLLERGPLDTDKPSTQTGEQWPYVLNENGQYIRWKDGTWGIVANVLGGGTSINGGYSFQPGADFYGEIFGYDMDLSSLNKTFHLLADELAQVVPASKLGDAWTNALEQNFQGTAEPQPSLKWREGSWRALATIHLGTPGLPRFSAARLLHNRRNLRGLKVRTEILVHKIIFNENIAVGVAATEGNTSQNAKIVKANKGVLLAAGAVVTPQLLQLSGVGDDALLGDLGIKVVKDNPAVGSNFIDRNVLELPIRANLPGGLEVGPVVANNDTAGMTFEIEAGGAMVSEFAIASLGLSEPAGRSEFFRPLLKLAFRQFLSPEKPSFLGRHMSETAVLLSVQHDTKSRGTVAATSLDIREPPEVDAKFFSDDQDVLFAIEGYRELYKIARSEYMAPFFKKPKKSLFGGLLPKQIQWFFDLGGIWGDNFSCFPCMPEDLFEDVELARAWLLKNTLSHYHYFGTAAIGTVVEPTNLEVIGTKRLHVIDASIYPKSMRVNPQHMLMAMGFHIGQQLHQLWQDE